jgi:hypothetical protein
LVSFSQSVHDLWAVSNQPRRRSSQFVFKATNPIKIKLSKQMIFHFFLIGLAFTQNKCIEKLNNEAPLKCNLGPPDRNNSMPIDKRDYWVDLVRDWTTTVPFRVKHTLTRLPIWERMNAKMVNFPCQIQTRLL